MLFKNIIRFIWIEQWMQKIIFLASWTLGTKLLQLFLFWLILKTLGTSAKNAAYLYKKCLKLKAQFTLYLPMFMRMIWLFSLYRMIASLFNVYISLNRAQEYCSNHQISSPWKKKLDAYHVFFVYFKLGAKRFQQSIFCRSREN